ncbi:hypothetical protein [Corallococcus terminator]|uniref:Uncharacterized protein n=1 Tax=Corallococcus terminator TaxID=2316733 RepID=A0A3A8HHH6_9BACT|nr:hypothetical protein [Corallococcus terminator]RKG70707.1 hypothetical protein D7V88_39565 [Corallococcus terminator]
MIALTWTYGQLLRGVADLARRVLLVQLLILAPCFWLLELSQNVAFRWMNGDWGWVYPESPHRGFSVVSLGLWSGAVVALWALNTLWFRPARMALWQRVLWTTALCWPGQWLCGFIAAEVFHHPFQVWPGTRLLYVSFSSLFFWAANALLYQWVVRDPQPVAPRTSEPASESLQVPVTRAERPAGA